MVHPLPQTCSEASLTRLLVTLDAHKLRGMCSPATCLTAAPSDIGCPKTYILDRLCRSLALGAAEACPRKVSLELRTSSLLPDRWYRNSSTGCCLAGQGCTGPCDMDISRACTAISRKVTAVAYMR